MKSASVPIRGANPWKRFVFPGLTATAALAVAVVGAMLTGNDSGADGVNGFVETLSGSSSSYLGGIGVPLGVAFAAGMAAAVNPCGFAMLPAYLGLYLGSNENQGNRAYSVQYLARALLVGGVVTSGFVLLFGIAGAAIGAGSRSVVEVMPWLGLAIGVLLAVIGSWLLAGGKLYSGLAGRAAARVGDPGSLSVRGYFLFGLSYGIASLSCTLPIFMIVVGTTVAVSGVPEAIGQFVLYALGMGLVIMVLTIGIALFHEALVGALRKALPYVQPFSAVLMLVAGSYIVYYWLTIGDLGGSIENVL